MLDARKQGSKLLIFIVLNARQPTRCPSAVLLATLDLEDTVTFPAVVLIRPEARVYLRAFFATRLGETR